MITRLFALSILAFALYLSGCAYLSKEAAPIAAYIQSPATQANIQAALAYVEQQATALAEKVVLGAAVSEVDSNFKGNFLSYISQQLYVNENTLTQANQVQALVQTLAPNNGSVWTTLASGLATQYSNAQASAGHPKTSQIVAALAAGLVAPVVNPSASGSAAASVP